MLRRLILVFLALSIELQCHAFKEIKRRSSLSISTISDGNFFCISSRCHLQHRHVLRQHKSISVLPVFSIRGGSDGYDEDEFDDTAYEFIASFESELAQIRREAELEAEEEMQKLRSLIERRAILEEVNTVSDHNENDADDSYEIEAVDDDDSGNKDEPADNNLIQEGTAEAIPIEVAEEEVIEIRGDESPDHILTSEVIDIEVLTDEETEEDIEEDDEIDKVATDDETVETAESDDESDAKLTGDEIVEEVIELDEIGVDENDETLVDDGEDLQHNNLEFSGKTIEVGDHLVESDSEARGSGEVEDDEGLGSDVLRDTMPKASKKKRRLSKTSKSKGKKKRVNLLSDESELSDFGESTMLLAHTQDELTEPRQSGIWFYLRSDLGRALCLFIATVLLALLTQRMQRQLEAEGN